MLHSATRNDTAETALGLKGGTHPDTKLDLRTMLRDSLCKQVHEPEATPYCASLNN